MNPKVSVRVQQVVIPTYPTVEYEKLPQFAENRVHQRFSGNPYPNPVVEQVLAGPKEDKLHTIIVLENDFIEVSILPELGGKIFSAKDKTNGYDFFYRQHVIKPALIGMLGLWVSGGVEFNWPIHHRPSTFLPTDYKIIHEEGGITVYLSELEPLSRMKGLVGIHLSPDSAVIETRIRLYNRTELPQSFLFWENAAVPVNKQYRIFFPQDVSYVNFHYKKARGAWPIMDSYFNTQDNRGGRDIRFHANTESATSYFCGPTGFDFFGGYDEGKKAGVLHVASHYTSIGKKMFTWGYRRMERSWEHALTDTDGAYAELMAGSYTDNQPDTTWIEPGEIRSFKQFWYPFKEIGEVVQANLNAAISTHDGILGIYPVRELGKTHVCVLKADKKLFDGFLSLHITQPQFLTIEKIDAHHTILLTAEDGTEILAYYPVENSHYVPDPWKDNPAPNELNTAESCYLCGLHVEQYHDPLLSGIPYWQRGLQLDCNHAGCLVGLGTIALKRLRFEEAEKFLRHAIRSLSRFNPHPRDTEAYYLLALALAHQGKDDEAYDMAQQALWNQKTLFPAYLILVRILCKRQQWTQAISLIEQAREETGFHQEEAVLHALCHHRLGNSSAALSDIQEVLQKDPLDPFAICVKSIISGTTFTLKAQKEQVLLDVVTELAAAGFTQEAIKVLSKPSSYPMLTYVRGFLSGNSKDFTIASKQEGRYCFPSRPIELAALQKARETNPKDTQAALYLGNLLYGVSKDYEHAEVAWKQAGDSPCVLRNLALAAYNRDNTNPSVLPLLETAIEKDPASSQLVLERMLVGRLQGESPERRISFFTRHASGTAMEKRDDLFLEQVRAENEAGHWEEALRLLYGHVFIPCEGGESSILTEYLFAIDALGRQAISTGNPEKALAWFQKAKHIPENLGGGAWHSVVLVPYLYEEGVCFAQLGNKDEALRCWNQVIDYPIDYFTTMYLPSYPIWRGKAHLALGQLTKGTKECTEALKSAILSIEKPDYGPFNTTPYFISYRENPRHERIEHFTMLIALALFALGRKEEAKNSLRKCIALVPNHRDTELMLQFEPL